MTKRKTTPHLKTGRPRTVSPNEEESISLAKEMLEWVIINKPLHIKQFYSIEKRITHKDWDTISKKPEFIPYYESAMSIIALNYVNGTIHPSIANRFLRIYFGDLRNSEDDTKSYEYKLKEKLVEFEYNVKHKVLEKVSDDVKEQFDSLMKQISDMKTK